LSAVLPPQLQSLIPTIVSGVHEAFSLAIADTFWFGLLATSVALIAVVLALPERPLRGFAGRDVKEAVPTRTVLEAPAAE
jgi:hypothetical protein